jgi:hypothetical protein
VAAQWAKNINQDRYVRVRSSGNVVVRDGIGLRARRCYRSLSEWEATNGPMSVVEYVPADRASTSLVIEDQFLNLRGESFSLPLSFPDACRSVSSADAEAPTALIAYAAAPRSSAATCAAAFAAKAARRASPMRTSPRTHARPTSMASHGRVSRGCSSSKRCRTCSAHRAAEGI